MAADTRDVLAWRKRDASRPPPLLRYRSAKWFIMTTICIAVFTVCRSRVWKTEYISADGWNVGPVFVWHCRSSSRTTLFRYHDSLCPQVVPVIPFALSIRAGVPEADGGSADVFFDRVGPRSKMLIRDKYNIGYPSSWHVMARPCSQLPVGSSCPRPPSASSDTIF